MQSFTRIYLDPGLKGKERLKVEIQTYSKAQKPWQKSLLLSTTDFIESKSRNTPDYTAKLSWLQEKNKFAFCTNAWEGLSQLNPPCLDILVYNFCSMNLTKAFSVLEMSTCSIQENSFFSQAWAKREVNQSQRNWDLVSFSSIFLSPRNFKQQILYKLLCFTIWFRIMGQSKWETRHIDHYQVLKLLFQHQERILFLSFLDEMSLLLIQFLLNRQISSN